MRGDRWRRAALWAWAGLLGCGASTQPPEPSPAISTPATVVAEPKEPKEPTVAAKPTQATVAAEPYQPESDPFPLCSGFHALDWRMGWLMDNESFVSQLDQHERKARSWGSEERELFAISAARHLYEFLQSQSRHRRPEPELVERLLGYHRQLARGRQSVEASCVADLSSYFGALDTETLGAAPLAARPLWREAVARNPQAWIDARRYPKSLPRDIDTYRASARLGLARNLAHYEPTDRDGAQALLLEAEGIDTRAGGAKARGAKASGAKARGSKASDWASYHQAAHCYRAELAWLAGDRAGAEKLFGELRRHVDRFGEERIAARLKELAD